LAAVGASHALIPLNLHTFYDQLPTNLLINGKKIARLLGNANLTLTTTTHTGTFLNFTFIIASETNDPIDTFEPHSHVLINYVGPLTIGFKLANNLDNTGSITVQLWKTRSEDGTTNVGF